VNLGLDDVKIAIEEMNRADVVVVQSDEVLERRVG
jgi:hypothetical protein